MRKIFVSALLFSVLSASGASAADPMLSNAPTAGQAVPPALVQSQPAMQPTLSPTTATVPAVVAVEPAIIGANATAVAETPAPIVGASAPVAMPAVAVAPVQSHPLCAVAHTPSADVAHGQQVAVGTPRTIPLSVDLAGALNIKGFENIKSEGPIGFVTIDQSGRVLFEGQDLSTNVNNLCSSGAPIPPVPAVNANAAPAPMSMDRAPDGSTYSDMPGQTGFRMKPIVDGPSYKVAPKRKKKPAAPKPAVTEETLPAAETTTEAAPAEDASMAPASTDSALPTTGDAMVPASEDSTTSTVPMPSPVSDLDAPAKSTTSVMTTGAPADAETGPAVEEVLGTQSVQ